MFLLIDSYDSFTYNLYDLIKRIGQEVEVVYNDKVPFDAIDQGSYEGIILSPGPSHPREAGDLIKVIEKYGHKLPILGICLGHQAIGEAFGSKVVKADHIMHGKLDTIETEGDPIFKGLEKQFSAVRYHSLVIDKQRISGELKVIARANFDQEIMAVKHRDYPIYGLQFHPESYETKVGEHIMMNFIQMVKESPQAIGHSKEAGEGHMDVLESENVANDIFNARISKENAIDYLLKIRKKGETPDEIAGFAKAMKSNATQISGDYSILCDTCGTGGDGLHTFNISTASAFVLASAGIHVAKHGNRSVSSKCGSADVIEALGGNIDLTANQANAVLKKSGIVFLFAQKFHPKMKYVMPIRKSIEGPTIFNVIGPLSNPAPLTHQVIGVYKKELMEPMLMAMKSIGLKAGATVHGHGGMDELSLEGTNKVLMYKNDVVRYFEVNATDYGLKAYTNEDLRGGDATINAHALKQAFQGENEAFAMAIALNAGFSLYLFDKADSINDGVQMAMTIIKDGRALSTLNQFILASQAVPHEYA